MDTLNTLDYVFIASMILACAGVLWALFRDWKQPERSKTLRYTAISKRPPVVPPRRKRVKKGKHWARGTVRGRRPLRFIKK